MAIPPWVGEMSTLAVVLATVGESYAVGAATICETVGMLSLSAG